MVEVLEKSVSGSYLSELVEKNEGLYSPSSALEEIFYACDCDQWGGDAPCDCNK